MAPLEDVKSLNPSSRTADFSSGEESIDSPRLSISNPEPRPIDGPSTLHSLITHNHDDLALDFAGPKGSNIRLSYQELQNQSTKLAKFLVCSQALSKKSQQTVIPILIPQSLELYLAILAILKAGCAFCPLPLDAPLERMKFIAQDVQASMILSGTTTREKLATLDDVDVLCIEELMASERDAEGCLPLDIKSTQTAYVMYTSGSTGKPKGVPVSHKAATQSLLAHDKHIPHFSRFLQFAAPTFDVSVFEIFFTFFRGATLVARDRMSLLNDLPGTIRDMNVDAAELTPTVAGGLLKYRENAPNLKLLLTIGEMLTPQVVKEFGGDETKESILWAMYGPTEATIHCTMQPAFDTNFRVGNIGFPFDNVSAFIVSPSTDDTILSDIQVLPLGEVGELAVGGYQLADGYLNRPDQNNKAFVDTEQYGRLYLTGDKARMLPDGSLECFGRISAGQVKLRGQRIELGEIEAAALRAEGCHVAVACVIRGSLIVFCQVSDESISMEAIEDACRKWLPTFMVPGEIVLVTELPKLASGKVDRKQLELEYDQRSLLFTKPEIQTADEVTLEICELIGDVVGQSIRPEDHLAAAGLDSLLAIRAASHLRENGFELSTTELMSAVTASDIRAIVQTVDVPVEGHPAAKSRNAENILSKATISKIMKSWPKTDIQDVITCTPLQISMLAETAKDPRMYCNWVEFEFQRKCTSKEIKAWIEKLCSTNEILRSGFCELDDSIQPYAQIIWSVIADTQISEVDRLDYPFEISETFSLARPIHFQIRHGAATSTLLMQLHHALYDGWSMDLMVHDLARISVGEEPPVRPQFREVSQYSTKLDNRLSRVYWQEQFADFIPTPMPKFHGPSFRSNIQASQCRTLSTSRSKLHESAVSLGVSPQSFVHAAIAYIVSSYLTSSDIVIATVTSGRTLPIRNIHDIIGPCIATLPVRLNVSHANLVRDLVGLAYDRTRRTLPYATLPYREIKAVCSIDPTVPLSDVLFIWQESLQSRDAVEDSKYLRIVDQSDQLEFKLVLEIEPRDDGLHSKATFLCDTFSDAQVNLFLQQLDALVAMFSRDTQTQLTKVTGKLPLDVISTFNLRPKLQEFDRGLASTVSDRALRTPNDVAVLFASSINESRACTDSLTYRQLNVKANQLAQYLISRVRPEEHLVIVCMPKSLDLYVSILAVLKAGRGYLPITPETPKERVDVIIREANAQTVLSVKKTAKLLQFDRLERVVNVDALELSSMSTADPEISFPLSNTAYAVFTSGSTGVPKGIQVTQLNLLSNLKVLSDIYPCHDNARLLQACSQAFDVSAFEIFFSWYSGMCLCSASNDVLFPDLELSIRQLKITHLSLTPTVAALVIPENVPSVKFLVTAGEGVTEKVKRTWASHALYQGYGPSETTNICTVKPDVQEFDLINNIGPPLKNTSLLIYKPGTEELVLRGSVGELCFGGDQVFAGYLNMPELTDQKIILHPKYGRVYRSGDLGRLLPDGSILFDSRIDDQVKLRGQRVELGEINRALLDHDETHDCFTLCLQEKEEGSEKLVSFIVLKSFVAEELHTVATDTTIRNTLAGLLDTLSRQLPSYMVPSHIVPITKLPRTSQGKIDRSCLSDFYQNLSVEQLDLLSLPADARLATEVWSKTELKLGDLISSTLSTRSQSLNKHASLFGLGLDSISAIRFARLIRDHIKKEITVSTILQNPSISRLAFIMDVEDATADLSSVHLAEIFSPSTIQEIKAHVQPHLENQTQIEEILPCTPLQEAMISSTATTDTDTYCNVMELTLRRTLGDVDRLSECFLKMIDRHAILRTCFVATKQEDYPYAQVLLSTWKKTFSVVSRPQNRTSYRRKEDLCSLKERVREALWAATPPIIFELLYAAQDTVVRFACHHALYDASAIALLLHEVELAYHDQNLPPIIPYKPFLEASLSARSKEAVKFWTDELKGLQPLVFTIPKSSTRHTIKHQLKVQLSTIEKAAQNLRVSWSVLLQATWAKVLAMMFRLDDVCFGYVFSGRTIGVENLDKLVAPTFNTLPIRVNFNQYKTNNDVVMYLQNLNARALDYHQLTPLRSIQQRLSHNEGLFSTILLFPFIFELIPNKDEDVLDLHLSIDHSLDKLLPIEATLGKAFTAELESCMVHPAAGVFGEPEYLNPFSDTHYEVLQKHILKPSAIATSQDLSTTTTSEKLKAILFSLLPAANRDVTPDTTIYQLGLDSIGVLQLVARLRKEMYISVSAADILEHPTLANLDRLLQAREPKNNLPNFDFDTFQQKYQWGICTKFGIESSSIDAIWPCTPLQMGLLSQFIQNQDSYINAVTYKLEDRFSLPEILVALKGVVSAHPMLRTGFVPVDDPVFSFAMVTYTPTKFDTSSSIRVIDRPECLETLRTTLSGEFLRQLQQPPWRIFLSETQQGLFMQLIIFHGLFDRQSLDIILSDVQPDLLSDWSPIPTVCIQNVLSNILTSFHPERAANKNDNAAKFWKRHLLEASKTSFPCLQPLNSKTGSTVQMTKCSSMSRGGLNKSCERAGITLLAIAQTAWAIILAQYTGQSDVVFGTVLSGREIDSKAEPTAFPTVVTVPTPVRTDLHKMDIINNLVKFNGSVRRHQFTPLNSIYRWINRSGETLFDTLFVLQSGTPLTSVFEVMEELSTSEYPVSLELDFTSQGKLLIRVTFNVDVVPPEQAKILLNQYDAILRNLFDEKEIPESLFSISLPKEKIIPSPVEYLHEFVELRARQNPDQIALEFAYDLAPSGRRSMITYKNLDESGNKIANFLASREVPQGSLVGVCFDKCPEASIVMLGILKAGCAFLAIDPSAPADRKAFIMQDSEAALVLTTATAFYGPGADREDGPNFGSIPIISLDGIDWDSLSAVKPTLAFPFAPVDTCYCLYTSGTTGTPKGCLISHRNAVQAMRAFSRLFAGHWNSNSRFLQFASYHFDVSVLEQYWSWSENVRVVSAPRDVILQDLPFAINALGITHIDLTPSLATLLRPEEVPTLCEGVFITGGEKLKQDIIDVWGPKGVIYNGYGPTETTIGVTMFPRVPANGRPSNIGYPFDNVGIAVLHEDEDDVAIRGGMGELCVSGMLVGKGYLKRQELSAQKFPALPFPNPPTRFYRTGDMVRLLHDGSIDYLGRADEQFKLRGQRLEAGEINHVIWEAFPDDMVNVSSLVVKRAGQQREQLVAFLSSRKAVAHPQQLTVIFTTAMQSFCQRAAEVCRSKLPGYMVPSHFIPVSHIPLTSNNKKDRRALQQVFDKLSNSELRKLSGDESTISLTSTQQMIAETLGKITTLQTDDIQPDSNLFELGLDSISVHRFSRELRERDFLNAKPATIMKYDTIKSLANVLDKSPTSQETASRQAIIASRQFILAFAHRHRFTVLNAVGQDVSEIAPCTPLQEGIISRSLAGELGLYFNSFQLKLAQTVDGLEMKLAWEKLCEDLPILRTRFVHTDEGFAQAVLRRPSLPWEELKVSDSSDLDAIVSDRKKLWLMRSGKTLERPFEIYLVRSNTKSRLIINIFHALYDADSINLMLHLLYRRYTQQETIGLETDFIRALPYGPLLDVEGTEDFWKTQVSPSDVVGSLSMPTSGLKSEPVRAHLLLNSGQQLEVFRRRLNITHQAIFQACWLAVLQQYASGPLVVGIVVSGRQLGLNGAETVVGPMFNTIPFKLDFLPQDTWASIIRRCHNFNVAALPFQHTPLRRIYKSMKRPTHQPLFESLFVFKKATETTTLAATNELWTLMPSDAIIDYPLALEVEWLESDNISLQLAGRGDVLGETTAQSLLNDLKSMLEKVVLNPDGLANLPKASLQYDLRSHVRPQSDEDVVMLDLPTSYDWTTKAILVRREIAMLSEVEDDEITEQSSIFELGMDSIDAIKLASRLKNAGFSIAVSKIMQQPSISDIVRNAADVSQPSSSQPFDLYSTEKGLTKLLIQSGLDLSNVERVLPCTPLQEGMLIEMTESNFERYYNFDFLEVAPEVDITMLERAWNAAFAGAPILRMAFTPVDAPQYGGAWAQVVSRFRETPWLSLRWGDGKEVEVVKLIREDVAKSPTAPAFRVILLQQPSKMTLILAIPHAMYDGWSLQLLHNAIFRLYRGEAATFPSNDFALTKIMGGCSEESQAFWKNYLIGATPCIVPVQQHSKSAIASALHVIERKSTVPLVEIRAFCKRQGVTLQALGQLCWTLVLAQRVQKLNVVFGVVLSGRDSAEMQEVLFPTMNTVAFRSFVHGSRREMLRYTQETMSSIQEHQYFPLNKAQRFANAQNGKLFNTIFIQQMNPLKGKSADISIYKSVRTEASVEYAICVEMEVVDESFVWRVACKADTLNETGAQSLINSLNVVLVDLLGNIDGSSFKTEGHDLRMDIRATHTSDLPKEPLLRMHRDGIAEKDMTLTEKKILSTISAIAKVPEHEINMGDTIFSLGLDSISVMKVSALLRKESLFLTVSQILKGLTISGIAALASKPVENKGGPNERDDPILVFNNKEFARILRIPADSIDCVLPATAGQVYALASWRVSNGNHFFVPHTLSVPKTIPRDAIVAAWGKLVTRNPILRTVFLPTNSPIIPVAQIVLKAGPSATRGHCIRISTYADIVVSDKTNDRWTIELYIHHALYDAVSVRRLFQEFNHFLSENKSKDLDDVQYDAFSSLICDSYTKSAIGRAQKYWTEYLDGLDEAVSTCCGVHFDIFDYRPGLDGTQTHIDEIARSWSVSPPAVLIAAWGMAYYLEVVLKARPRSAKLRCHDVVIGVYMANRSFAIKGLDTVIAPTFNVVPLRIRSPDTKTIRQIATQVQGDLIELGDPEISMAGLWQIKEWTGLTINSFINILPPEAGTGDDNDILVNEDDQEIDIANYANIPRTHSSAIESVRVAKDVAERLLSGLEGQKVYEAYPHAITMEAAIRRGRLDVGLFAAGGILERNDVGPLRKAVIGALLQL